MKSAVKKYVALGLALSQGLVKFTVVNLHGEIIHEETFKLPEILTPEYFAETIGRQIQLKIASYGYFGEFYYWDRHYSLRSC